VPPAFGLNFTCTPCATHAPPNLAGGDSDRFKEINEAYDVLKDPEKRKIYDEVGSFLVAALQAA
jgi:hypothetical protein